MQSDGLYRVLRALASLGIFDETSPRTFALTPSAELLRKGPGRLGDGIEFITDPLHFQTYAEAMYSVQTGKPAGEKVVGMPLFEYLAKTPEWSASFNNAMTAFSANVMPAVLKVYDFSGIGTLVDVAGGHGHVLTSVLREYPQMRGVLFDLDHVVAGSGPLLAASGVGDRVRTERGDFFKAVPAGGDAYIMKHIIHDWDDDRAVAILSSIRKALEGKPQGRVILLEAALAPGNAPGFRQAGRSGDAAAAGRPRTHGRGVRRAVQARRLHADERLCRRSRCCRSWKRERASRRTSLRRTVTPCR